MSISQSVLQAVVADFKARKLPRRRKEADWVASMPTLADVIRTAGMAVNRRGKRDPHHGRRQRATLEECTRILLAHENDLRRSKDFDDVYLWVDKLLEDVRDVNKLYYYDAAVLIAMKLGFSPTKVYLHSGAADGAVVLLGISKKTKWILPSDLPAPLSDLKADELEDLLCIYKECFEKNRLPHEAERLACDGEPVDEKEIS